MGENTYHVRRMEKDMSERAEQMAVLRGQKFLTLAMAHGDEPYLVTLNYALDEAENCFYCHCATEGRKLEFLRANARVWGQVIEDRGYIEGKCSHAYRSVMFGGRVEFIEDAEAKQRVLGLMIDQMDASPDSMKKRMLTNSRLKKVLVFCVRIEAMSGKQSPPPAQT